MTTYPGGGGKHVFVPELEVVHTLQDGVTVLLALEEVGAAEDAGATLGLVSLDKHRLGAVVRLHAPGGISR